MAENYITSSDEKGTINISEEVVVSMVRAAVNEIDGVAALNNNAGAELAEFLGIKSSKGLKVQFQEGVILIDAIIMVRYGANVVSVAKQVQEEVASAVENVTGLPAKVNVHVSGVAFDK